MTQSELLPACPSSNASRCPSHPSRRSPAGGGFVPVCNFGGQFRPWPVAWTGTGIVPQSSHTTASSDHVPISSSTNQALAPVKCQLPWGGANPTMPGMFPTMFPLATGQPFGALPVMPVQAMTQQATRHARRVYVGGLPPTATEQSVATFFSQVMAAIGGNTAGPGDAVVNVYINHVKKFAFVDMRSVEEASNAMALDGIIFEGAPVKVRRRSDYNPSLAATLGPSQSKPNPNLNLAAVGLTPGSAGGLEGPDRIFVGGLPYNFTEEQIKELLESFGPLRGFDLVKDRETGNSKGYAFCVYQDLSVTDTACAALNGIKMGDKTLTVRRANQGANQRKPEQERVLLLGQQQIALQPQVQRSVASVTELQSHPNINVPQATNPYQHPAAPVRQQLLQPQYMQPPRHPPTVVLMMEIPQSYWDNVIGKTGAILRYIRRASGAIITVQMSMVKPEEMAVQIRGRASEVKTAQELIRNFMAYAALSAQSQDVGSTD
ncbi:U2 snRNP auxilliary factor, large subunit, splicing factor [Trema orientale]|uniref:Splicing factor U2af large subunit n=1 Tax=Trema orientale TaxID=63057 RepID=A0A2P5FPU8_TREOI|nr:U2 snRNP auxilliary factor, large subunit, splicing factor [Trema orientale]